jgi:hypothetical protein
MKVYWLNFKNFKLVKFKLKVDVSIDYTEIHKFCNFVL